MSTPIDIFLSRPSTVAPDQARFCAAQEQKLSDSGLRSRTVGVTDFGNSVPHTTVLSLMRQCSGVLILGLAKMYAVKAVAKPGSNREAQLGDVYLATPWNHLEAGLAAVLELPMMILRQSEVRAEGILDIGVSDRFVHHAKLTDVWLTEPSFTQPFEEWVLEVRDQASRA